MRWEQPVHYGSLSDIGFRRRNNEDSLLVQLCSDPSSWARHGHVFVVADGMGGHAVGELASKIAVDTLPQTFFKSRHEDISASLKRAIELSNAAIHERGVLNREFQRMGTTCSSLVLGPQGAVVGHVGDSRVYRIRGGRIDQLTFDHSLQWELLHQRNVDPNEVYLHEPRHVITRSLGPDPKVEVDLEGPYQILPGDTYVLCSDGLTGHVNDAEIGAIARELPPDEACKLLVHLANLRGGSDNISVIAVRVREMPEGLVPEEDREQAAREQAMSWWWLAAYWLLAMLFVAGILLILFQRRTHGVVLTATAASTALAIGLLSFRNRFKTALRPFDTAETVLWNPYRSASARLSPKFVNHLAAVQAELQRTAAEEGWSIDWGGHETASQRARSAFAERQYGRALREYARAVDILMAGLYQHRRQINRDAKSGRTAPPSREPFSG